MKIEDVEGNGSWDGWRLSWEGAGSVVGPWSYYLLYILGCGTEKIETTDLQQVKSVSGTQNPLAAQVCGFNRS